jgi:Xaa-Pro aminopeptidase
MDFREIAEKCPAYPQEYKDQRYPMIAHGDGMSDEWPTIYWPDQSWSGFGNDPDVLEENMVISIEGLASKTGARESVKLEEEVLITANGPEILSKAAFDERFLT